MQDGSILDRQITASSEHLCYFGPKNARLNHHASVATTGTWSSGSWSVRSLALPQWIQVHLLGVAKAVSGVVLQGRQDLDQWVTAYKVQYGNDSNKLLTATPMISQYQDKLVRP